MTLTYVKLYFQVRFMTYGKLDINCSRLYVHIVPIQNVLCVREEK